MERALPPSKKEVGQMPREGDSRRDWVGRDTTILAFCWDDWDDGGREKVKTQHGYAESEIGTTIWYYFRDSMS